MQESTTKEALDAELIAAKERVGDYIRKSINHIPQSKIEGEAAYSSFGFLCSILKITTSPNDISALTFEGQGTPDEIAAAMLRLGSE